jgi:hypothetical protein
MSKNGTGNTHNLSTWLFAKQPSKLASDDNARLANGRQRLAAQLNRGPELRKEAIRLYKGGMTDPWDILYRLKLDR